MPVGAPALEVRGLGVDLGGQRVLSNVDLRVGAGEFVGIAGPNGGGKSTLLRAILDLVPSTGEVRFFGQPLAEFQRERGIGFLPQNAANVEQAFPASAQEIVAMGLTGTRRWPWRKPRAGALDVGEAMRATGVESLASRRIGEMSGGQRQRVLLAKALVANPDILILDEPTTGVDPAARDSFAHLLVDLNHARGVTIILVSHDADMLHHVAGRIVVVDRGIAADGPPDRVASTLHHLHGGH